MLRLVHRLQDENPAPLLAAGIPRRLAQVLWARGVRTEAEADRFLHPRAADLHDPFLLHGMRAATDRIHEAIAAGEAVVVYGDYDVDGVCAAAILVQALRGHGARADWYIPSRHREGYGLNPEAVRRIAGEARLMITVDCGITSLEEAALAARCGLDLIITDHHEPLAQLPEAVAVVNPLLGAYPFRRLCGAGVALKLVWALFGAAAAEPLWELAALATVADLVPLLDENRVIVHEGLRRMQETQRPGLRALFSVAGLEGKKITAGHLGFQVGPRINAGGRLAEASENVELLITRDAARAAAIAERLNGENATRQRMEKEIVDEAACWVQANVDFMRERAVVVAGEGWNTGVVGLAASKLVERFGWPTIVLSQSDEGMLTGSARSVPGVNIHAALSRCADLFTRFGGHAQAAGLTMAAENLPALRARLNEAIAELAEPDAFVPTAAYDIEATMDEITIALIEGLEKLAPTGFGNPAPVFCARGAEVLEARAVGRDGSHLKLRLAQADTAVDGIAFGQGAQKADLPRRVDVLFSPSINEFQGRRTAQCEVARLAPHAPAEAFRDMCEQRPDAFDVYWLEGGQRAEAATVQEAALREALATSCQGTLLAVQTLAGAREWLDWLTREGLSERVDYCFGAPDSPQRFNAFCALPQVGAEQGYERVFMLDAGRAREAVSAWLPSDDALRLLYKTLWTGRGQFQSERALGEACGLPLAAVRLGLQAFDELSLAAYTAVPFQISLLPARKCSLEDSMTLRRMRRTWTQEGGV